MRALLSVADRAGISAFARELLGLGAEVYATDGTREHLAADGIEVASVSELTNVPPLVGGQVKTFHPAVYAGHPRAARRPQPARGARRARHRRHRPRRRQRQAVRARGRPPAHRPRRGDRAHRCRRGGAPGRCGAQRRGRHRDRPSRRLRRRSRTSCGRSVRSRPRRAIASPPRRSAPWPRISRRSPRTSTRSRGTRTRNGSRSSSRRSATCAYGENPHQTAAFYRETTHRSGSLADATQLAGSPPSFNNLLDLDTAYRIASDYTAPTVVIAKHTDPVGIASADELVEAYRKALETDPVASFGGIVGVNRELDGPTAREIAANSYEAVVAPGFSHAALGILRAEARPRAPLRPARPHRGHARLRHRQPRLQARRRRAAGREARRARPRSRPAAGRHQAATRRSRS